MTGDGNALGRPYVPLLDHLPATRFRARSQRVRADPPMTDPYVILQVHRSAEPEVVRAAHRALARKHHPDFGGDPTRMAAINQAWAVLGNPARRAVYDAEPQVTEIAAKPSVSMTAQPPIAQSPTASETGLNATRPREPQSDGTVIDFGRYAGWTVRDLVKHDPNYLEWLARTPIGRRLTVEIESALAQRASADAAMHPRVSVKRRKGIFASFGSNRTAIR